MLLLLLAMPVQAEGGRLRDWLEARRAARTATPSEAPIVVSGDTEGTLVVAGQVRRFLVHVPRGLSLAGPVPLLIALHGGGGHMAYQADDSRYGLLSAAARHGFVVVFPNGYSRLPGGKLATWNAGACCGAARDDGADDVGFVRALVAHLARRLPLDRQRVFAAGMSNGGMMAYRLACELPDVVQGIASVAGTDNTVTCPRPTPLPVLHIHARNDTHVLFDGGAGEVFRNPAQVTEFTSVPETFARWRQRNGCTGPVEKVVERPGLVCEEVTACRAPGRLRLCVTETGGHSWPGAEVTRGEPASTALDASDAIWEFFTTTAAGRRF